MKANVQFLNVGWGDAHLIRLPSGSVTLIDGGDGSTTDSQDHPLDWMNRKGIDQLDWMILTHIHEDHVNGLLDIAKHKKVVKAVVPYEPFELPPFELVQQYGTALTARVYHMLDQYLELARLLIKQGTEIIWRNAYANDDRSVIWSEEGFVLTHLYPWENDPLPAYDLLLKAISESQHSSNTRIGTLERFFDLSNHDSSVYLLSVAQHPEECILFGGDQLEPGWERLSLRTELKSRVWKVSHHGLDDGFNVRILSWIRPEHCIIPISVEKSHGLQSHWDALRSLTATAFHLTGDVSKGKHVLFTKIIGLTFKLERNHERIRHQRPASLFGRLVGSDAGSDQCLCWKIPRPIWDDYRRFRGANYCCRLDFMAHETCSFTCKLHSVDVGRRFLGSRHHVWRFVCHGIDRRAASFYCHHGGTNHRFGDHGSFWTSRTRAVSFYRAKVRQYSAHSTGCTVVDEIVKIKTYRLAREVRL